MQIREFGDPSAEIVLIQMVDDHDLALIENEVKAIKENTSEPFRLIAVKVNDWNTDLSPWQAPAVFGKEDFRGGSVDTLREVLKLCRDESKTYYIGGYSLSGLFALWAAYETDVFKAVAAASPSVWFPGFLEYTKGREILCDRVYLSLGDKEEKTRNQVMARVGDNIREIYVLLKDKGIDCTLEWNEGNHFRDPDLRTAKAFSWVMKDHRDMR